MKIMNPDRRRFMGSTAQLIAGVAVGATLSSCADDNDSSLASTQSAVASPDPEGQVTQYFEFRVALPVNQKVKDLIYNRGLEMLSQRAFLSLSLKQMVGESTMVKNFPASYKGMLGSAYSDAVASQTLPYFYSLFVRFENYAALQEADFAAWFAENIAPDLYIYRADIGKTDLAFDYYSGVYQTVLCGDRTAVYSEAETVTQFLRSQVDAPEQGYVTVGNHVVIKDAQLQNFEERIVPLLEVAQNTYRPADAPDAIGTAGSADNTEYRKAVTTEILRNAFPTGDERDYIMHGVWESVWDHENSHLDIRFKQASMPVGALVIKGPVEPFYHTHVLVNNP